MGTLKFLIRKNENTYNIFTCKISNEVYRTSSINDFVLKSHKTSLGYLTRNEFRTGLFVAIWDRFAGDITLKNEEESKKKKLPDGEMVEKMIMFVEIFINHKRLL